MGPLLSRSLLPPTYPLGTAWQHISYVAALLSSSITAPQVIGHLNEESAAPIHFLMHDEDVDCIRMAYAAAQHSQHIFAAFIGLPSRITGTDGHAVGLVADFQQSNTFHFFDPQGPTIYSRNKRVRSWLLDYMLKVVPVLISCQDDGLLARVETDIRTYNIHPVEVAQGIQSTQAAAFREHEISYPGMCAFMTAHVLWRYVQHDGKHTIDQITNDITTDWIRMMVDFARTAWYGAMAEVSREPAFQQTLTDELRMFGALPHNKMCSMAEAMSYHASNSLHAQDHGNADYTSNNSYTSPPPKRRRSKARP